MLLVEVLPAMHGDSVLIRCQGKNERVNVLVDGGPRACYERMLRPRLQELAREGERLDLVVCTHIDADHIGGLLELFGENGPADSPNLISVDEVWFNTYRHVCSEGEPADVEQIERAGARLPLPTAGDAEGSGTISARQGMLLGSILRAGGYRWNHSFGGQAVCCDKKNHQFGASCRVAVVAPGEVELRQLGRHWRKALVKMGLPSNLVAHEFEALFESLILRGREREMLQRTPISGSDTTLPVPPVFSQDTSLANGSSISFLLTFEGRTVAMLGDSFPSTVISGIQALGAPPPGIDAVKVSHHGSSSSTSEELVRVLQAEYYIFSSDGLRHREHPALATVARVITASDSTPSLLFNYDCPCSQELGRLGIPYVGPDENGILALRFDGEVA